MTRGVEVDVEVTEVEGVGGGGGEAWLSRGSISISLFRSGGTSRLTVGVVAALE